MRVLLTKSTKSLNKWALHKQSNAPDKYGHILTDLVEDEITDRNLMRSLNKVGIHEWDNDLSNPQTRTTLCTKLRNEIDRAYTQGEPPVSFMFVTKDSYFDDDVESGSEVQE